MNPTNTFRTLPAPVPVRANTFRKESTPFLERLGAVIVGPDMEEGYCDTSKTRRIFAIAAILWAATLIGLVVYGICDVYQLSL